MCCDLTGVAVSTTNTTRINLRSATTRAFAINSDCAFAAAVQQPARGENTLIRGADGGPWVVVARSVVLTSDAIVSSSANPAPIRSSTPSTDAQTVVTAQTSTEAVAAGLSILAHSLQSRVDIVIAGELRHAPFATAAVSPTLTTRVVRQFPSAFTNTIFVGHAHSEAIVIGVERENACRGVVNSRIHVKVACASGGATRTRGVIASAHTTGIQSRFPVTYTKAVNVAIQTFIGVCAIATTDAVGVEINLITTNSLAFISH